ncbi:MAG: peptidoglycan-associated lipoprotein Pal [Acidobacteriota bacterium]
MMNDRVRTVGMMVALSVWLGLAPGCRTSPSRQGITGAGPDLPPPSAVEPSPERVTDPFGPGGSAALEKPLQETNLTEEAEDLAREKRWLEERLRTVYFDFDQATLTQEARSALDHNADLLRSRPALRVRIEGHCDERGTVEYNLALGDRRAHSALDYLAQHGVDKARIDVVSFGEERPVDLGHNEASWAKNRRADFHVQ